ncbi:hypothetical protein MAC_03909 [Metarhizium acridum CQMa 102]|uniref:Uncharacterized protein n=1 Tax=Metarhizium acridum (strain CQMa 102) TaxID=655827 RepID=E9E1U1_METAQ|nr:uncharacterized protein MAC_03909 [Metarhizium acridum CQMa 102]EFY90151.1 hypothetical protein MAC_03909 [Metarhizium acridum CQMa 102]
MLLVNILTLALVPATTCRALPQQDVRPDTCCFTIHDSSSGEIIRQQTSSGFLYLGGSQPTGWYCINLSDPNKILWDAFNNACFVNPDKVFQCLDPTPSNDSWGIEQSGGEVLVVVNGDSLFKVCPADSGSIIFTSARKDASCRGLTLKAKGLKGSCGRFGG